MPCPANQCMEVIKARVYSGKRAAHVHNMRKCITAGQTAGCVYAQEMIGVADMHTVFENSKMHMHVTKLLNEMQFKRSVYSTFCGLACSAEMKWSLHCPITCYSYMLQLHVAATMARDVTFFWPSDMQKCLAQNWQNAETGTVATMRCHIFRDD